MTTILKRTFSERVVELVGVDMLYDPACCNIDGLSLTTENTERSFIFYFFLPVFSTRSMNYVAKIFIAHTQLNIFMKKTKLFAYKMNNMRGLSSSISSLSICSSGADNCVGICGPRILGCRPICFVASLREYKSRRNKRKSITINRRSHIVCHTQKWSSDHNQTRISFHFEKRMEKRDTKYRPCT